METDFKKEDFSVKSVTYDELKEWMLYKHYAHRMPQVVYSFGLYDKNNILVGVITFGVPASHDLIVGAVGEGWDDKFLELNRLCVNDGLPRNTLSWFVAQSLKLLPPPLIIISYADSGMNHHGYIYQATNWIYTGLSKPHTDWLPEGQEGLHCRTLYDGKFSIKTTDKKMVKVERSRKHRYFMFLGDKRIKKQMMKALRFPIVKEYPKGDNVRYDSSYKPHVQLTLF